MRMKVLFLDDDPFRHELVLGPLKAYGARVVGVSTAKEAIDWIRREKFDLILLDHDLNGEVYAPSGPGTGYEVAEHVAGSPNRDTRIIVHSLNSVGAEKMVALIGRRAEWIPFYNLRQVLTNLCKTASP